MLDIQPNPSISMRDVDAHIDSLILPSSSPVSDAAKYHFLAGGSRVRAQLGLDAAVALKLTAQASMACAIAPELLHNASLIHDDLQDGDIMRRNQPAVWSRYGKDIAILTGDLLISAAYVVIAQHPYPADALRAIHDAIAVTINGQILDCSRKNATPEKYDFIAANKSGPLLALPIRLALIAAQAPGDEIAKQAGHAMAIAYQTLDDIEDRKTDSESGATNICLSLEALGHSHNVAIGIATARAHSALKAARVEACALQDDVGASFSSLADRLETKLRNITNAT